MRRKSVSSVLIEVLEQLAERMSDPMLLNKIIEIHYIYIHIPSFILSLRLA